MIKSLTNNVFDSINFLSNEMNKINQYNNIIDSNPIRKIIYKLIIEPYKDIFIRDSYLDDDYSYPLRMDTINIYNTDPPDYNIYFLNGYRFNDKYYFTDKDIPIHSFFIFDDAYTKNFSIVILEDQINYILNSIHTIFNENFTDISDDISDYELNVIKVQNKLIDELSVLINMIYNNKYESNNINQHYMYSSYLPTKHTLSTIISKNSLTFSYAMIYNYLKIIYPQYLDNSNSIRNIMKHILLTFLNENHNILNKDNISVMVPLVDQALDVFDYWNSDKFKSLPYEIKQIYYLDIQYRY